MIIESLYRKNLYKWRQLARTLLTNPSDIDDAIHVAVIKMIENMDSNKLKDWDRWSIAVLYFTCIDYYRKEKRKQSLEVQPKNIDWYGGSGSVDDKLAVDQQLHHLIIKAGMSPKHMEVLLKIFEEGYSYDECAKELGVSHNNISKIVSRFRKRI